MDGPNYSEDLVIAKLAQVSNSNILVTNDRVMLNARILGVHVMQPNELQLD